MLRKYDFDKKIKNEKLKMLVILNVASERRMNDRETKKNKYYYSSYKIVRIFLREKDLTRRNELGVALSEIRKKFYYIDINIGTKSMHIRNYYVFGKVKKQIVKI